MLLRLHLLLVYAFGLWSRAAAQLSDPMAVLEQFAPCAVSSIFQRLEAKLAESQKAKMSSYNLHNRHMQSDRFRVHLHEPAISEHNDSMRDAELYNP